MASNPKRHHYLPQTIQRNFLAEGESKLWYYDRKKDKYEQRTPKGLAHARHLYSYINLEPEQRYSLEKAFSTLEDKAAPAFLKLHKGQEIDSKEHHAISEFVGMQYFRTPPKLGIITELAGRASKYSIENMRTEIKNMSDEAFLKFIDNYNKNSGNEPSKITKARLIKTLLEGTITLNNDKNLQLKTLVDVGTSLGIGFSAREWIVLHTKPGSEFITSDVAVHLAPDGKPAPNTGFGPASPGMAVIFPFAKNAALMITSVRRPIIIHSEFGDEFLAHANEGLARVSGELYSSNKELLEKLVQKGGLAKTTFRPTFDEAQIQKIAQKHFFEGDSQTGTDN